MCALLVAIGHISDDPSKLELRGLEATCREDFFEALKCHALRALVAADKGADAVTEQFDDAVKCLLRQNAVLVFDADVEFPQMRLSFQIAADTMKRTVVVWTSDGSDGSVGTVFIPGCNYKRVETKRVEKKHGKHALRSLKNAAHVTYDGTAYAALTAIGDR